MHSGLNYFSRLTAVLLLVSTKDVEHLTKEHIATLKQVDNPSKTEDS